MEGKDDYYSSDAFSFLKKPKSNNVSSKSEETKEINKDNSHNIKEVKTTLKSTKSRNSQILYPNSSSHYEKNIKESNKAIYQEPVPNFDSYMAKGIFKIRNIFNILFE